MSVHGEETKTQDEETLTNEHRVARCVLPPGGVRCRMVEAAHVLGCDLL